MPQHWGTCTCQKGTVRVWMRGSGVGAHVQRACPHVQQLPLIVTDWPAAWPGRLARRCTRQRPHAASLALDSLVDVPHKGQAGTEAHRAQHEEESVANHQHVSKVEGGLHEACSVCVCVCVCVSGAGRVGGGCESGNAIAEVLRQAAQRSNLSHRSCPTAHTSSRSSTLQSKNRSGR